MSYLGLFGSVILSGANNRSSHRGILRSTQNDRPGDSSVKLDRGLFPARLDYLHSLIARIKLDERHDLLKYGMAQQITAE